LAYLLHHYLRDSAHKRPEHVALVDGERTLSYAELDARSDQLAARLVARGIRPGDRVGLYLPKSLESIVALFGILKAGGVYVPVDPKAPARRAAFILQDCAVSALIVAMGQLKELIRCDEGGWSLRVVLLAGDAASFGDVLGAPVERLAGGGSVPAQAVAPQGIDTDLAYILYTSGSTGKPKGVMLSHRHALNFVDWVHATFEPHAADRFSSHAPLHFDLSVLDVFTAIKSSATLLLVPDEIAAFPLRLAEWIESQQITVWYSVPSALSLMVTRGGLARLPLRQLRILFFAGEVFPMKYLKMLREIVSGARLVNLYGPTETNVCTYYEVPASLEGVSGDLPIGIACANMDAFAVTETRERAGVGEEGELLVRGSCLMTGYWGKAEMTASRLYQNPLHNAYDDPVYATGDIVRMAEDGNYQFLGRRDHMIKSRGYRIELGEIESVLYQNADVAEAAVVPVPDDTIGNRLVAVVAPAGGADLSEAGLKQHCGRYLPHYMVPEEILLWEALPKTSTGKTDRQQLLDAVLQRAKAKPDAAGVPASPTKGI
jgi:amino acid adenylation domain-containing protein